MNILWSRIADISSNRDTVYGICVSRDKVYGVGFDEYAGYGLKRYRVEAFNARSGEHEGSWVDTQPHPTASLFSCASVGGNLYVFGVTSRSWSTIVLSRELEIIQRTNVPSPYLIPLSGVVLGNYVYVAGTRILPDGSTSLYVAGISLDSLGIDKSFSLREPKWSGGYVIAYSDRIGQIVVGGFIKKEGGSKGVVLFLDKELELVKTIELDFSGAVVGIDIDDAGYIYAVGKGGVAKIERSAGVLAHRYDVRGTRVHLLRDVSAKPSPHMLIASGGELYILRQDNLAVVRRHHFVASGESLYVVEHDKLTVFERQSMQLTLHLSAPTVVTDIRGYDNQIYLALTLIRSESNWDWGIMAVEYRRGLLARILG